MVRRIREHYVLSYLNWKQCCWIYAHGRLITSHYSVNREHLGRLSSLSLTKVDDWNQSLVTTRLATASFIFARLSLVNLEATTHPLSTIKRVNCRLFFSI